MQLSKNKLKQIMEKRPKSLTSVKIDTELWDEFKVECVRRKFSFQKLAERAIYLYVTDEDFRKQIHAQTQTELDSAE